ncbi:hypothetical protein Tco_0936476 [Tanacetum coccineum]
MPQERQRSFTNLDEILPDCGHSPYAKELSYVMISISRPELGGLLTSPANFDSHHSAGATVHIFSQPPAVIWYSADHSDSPQNISELLDSNSLFTTALRKWKNDVLSTNKRPRLKKTVLRLTTYKEAVIGKGLRLQPVAHEYRISNLEQIIEKIQLVTKRSGRIFR